VDIPEQEEVDLFLPPYQPKIEVDTVNPCNMGQMSPPGVYMEMRHAIQAAMEAVAGCFEETEDGFYTVFNRKYGMVEAVFCEDADIILLATGTAVGTCRQVVSDLREKGEKAGLLKIKMFRPFPAEPVRAVLKNTQKVAVIDRNCSFGAGGIFAQETKAALCNMGKRPEIYSYIAGLGGRDITPKTVEEIYFKTKKKRTPENESVWIGLQV
jgi:pyruvate/2-oxoacid:ferredoxin oxidoreductase alpha subunit